MNIVIVGLEEAMETEDLGFRTRMIARNLAESPWVDTVVNVCCPEFFFRAIKPAFRKRRKYWDRFECVGKVGAAKVYKTGSKSYFIILNSLFPEKMRLLSAPNRRHIAQDIVRAIELLGLTIDVLWASNPRMVDIVKEIKAKRLVFDCIDNLVELSELQRYRSFIKDAYRWFGEQADIIYIANENQRLMFPGVNTLKLLQNGVDEVFFLPSVSVPPEISNIARPRIGYVGCMQDRFDIDLVSQLLDLLPSYTFVFIGPITIVKYEKHLGNYANVRILGSKHFRTIPDYIKGLDAVIVPHLVNELTNSMNPLKIYEALACGVPVVCTPISLAEDLRNMVAIAPDAKTFSIELQRAVKNVESGRRAELQSMMRVHSWAGRIDSIKADLCG